MMPEAAATKMAPPSTYIRLANCWPPSPRWCCTIILKATNSTPRMAIVKQIQHAQEMMVSTFVLTPGGAVPLPLVPGRASAPAVPATRSVVAVPVAVASAVAGSARRALARRESPARWVDIIGWLRWG